MHNFLNGGDLNPPNPPSGYATVDGTVASPATVPSSLDGTVAARLRYRLGGTVASALQHVTF